EALLAALVVANSQSARPIVETLLARGQVAGLRGLIEHFNILDDALRAQLLSHSDVLFRSLRETLQSRDERIRLNVIEIIRRGSLNRAAYLLSSGLH
ncbi:hypothetical protein QWJ41_20970, partial [Nocardioides sp. SOB44]